MIPPRSLIAVLTGANATVTSVSTGTRVSTTLELTVAHEPHACLVVPSGPTSDIRQEHTPKIYHPTAPKKQRANRRNSAQMYESRDEHSILMFTEFTGLPQLQLRHRTVSSAINAVSENGTKQIGYFERRDGATPPGQGNSSLVDTARHPINTQPSRRDGDYYDLCQPKS